MKLYKCECEYVLFPFGDYAPVCGRIYFQTKERKDLVQCIEKGCKYYSKIGCLEMKHIVFEYKDKLSNGKWNRQECTVSSLQECIKIYGLGIDCEYRIISIKNV